MPVALPAPPVWELESAEATELPPLRTSGDSPAILDAAAASLLTSLEALRLWTVVITTGEGFEDELETLSDVLWRRLCFRDEETEDDAFGRIFEWSRGFCCVLSVSLRGIAWRCVALRCVVLCCVVLCDAVEG